MKFLYDVSHHACCMTFSALVDLHFHSFFSPNQMYICDSLHDCAYLSILHALLALHLCSVFIWVTAVPFVIWFFGFVFSILFAYYVFSCVVSVHDVYPYHLNSILLFYDLFFTLYLYAIKFLFYSSLMQFGDQCQKCKFPGNQTLISCKLS